MSYDLVDELRLHARCMRNAIPAGKNSVYERPDSVLGKNGTCPQCGDPFSVEYLGKHTGYRCRVCGWPMVKTERKTDKKGGIDD